jgi:hypothetical protein
MARPPSGRPTKYPPRPGVQLAFRLSPSLGAALDRAVEQLRRERPGAVIRRSDVAREILGRALLGTGSKRTRAA